MLWSAMKNECGKEVWLGLVDGFRGFISTICTILLGSTLGP
jgi:hypothetical protein